MFNIFKVRSCSLNLAAFQPYKFNNSKLCPFLCNTIEDMNHIVTCKKLTLKEPVKVREEKLEEINKKNNKSHNVNHILCSQYIFIL